MKKGVYFMLLSTVFLMVFLVSFYIISVKENTAQIQSENYRIQLMNDFLIDFENDAPRAMYVASFRAFIALEENVFVTGEYYNDLEGAFSEAFFNGTVNGTSALIMNDSAMSDYLTKVNSIANKLGLNIDYELLGVNMYHLDPWNIEVELFGQINLTDERNIASWLYNTSIVSEVPIFDLRDPIYTVGAIGKLPSPIKQWNVSKEFVDDATNNTENLQDFLNGTYYIEDTGAPSFLMRFRGNLSPSTNGIVSLVNLRILGDQGIDIESGESVVDYVYFGNNNTANYCDIDGMIFTPNWFVIDQASAPLFEIDQLGKSTC